MFYNRIHCVLLSMLLGALGGWLLAIAADGNLAVQSAGSSWGVAMGVVACYGWTRRPRPGRTLNARARRQQLAKPR